MPDADRQLLALVQRLGALRTLRPTASRALAPLVRSELASSFTRAQSPDGRPWPARAKPTAHPPLQASGRLRRGFSIEPDGAGVRVVQRTPYAAAHQHGARLRRARTRRRRRGAMHLLQRALLPARPFVPVARWAPKSHARLLRCTRDTVRILLGITRP